MAIDQRDSQLQSLAQNTMQRINIRTMKKDLKKLRENDAKKEGQHIMSLNPNEPKPVIPFKDPSFDDSPLGGTVPKFKAPEGKIGPLPKIHDDIYQPDNAAKEEPAQKEADKPILDEVVMMPGEAPGQKAAADLGKEELAFLKKVDEDKKQMEKEEEESDEMVIRVPEPKKAEAPPAPKVVIPPPAPKVVTPPAVQEKPMVQAPTPTIKPIEEPAIFREPTAVRTQRIIEYITPEVKQQADETEKQQIFLLEGQLKQAQGQIQEIAKAQEPVFITEKNNILVAQKKLQHELSALLEKSKKAPDHEKPAAEKQRWSIEREMAKLGIKMKEVEQSYKKIKAEEKNLLTKTDQINHALKKIAANIKKREEEKKKVVHHKPVPAPLGHSPTGAAKPVEKALEVEVTPLINEQLKAAAQKEEEIRRKFMEDVEHWAAMNQNKK